LFVLALKLKKVIDFSNFRHVSVGVSNVCNVCIDCLKACRPHLDELIKTSSDTAQLAIRTQGIATTHGSLKYRWDFNIILWYLK
jgi:hypothetical protein